MNSLYIGAFGLCGIFLRYGIDQLVLAGPTSFPIATFCINVSGSFLAGLIYALGMERGVIPAELRIGLLIGFCGGFTTFSAYSLQSFVLLELRRPLMAILYLFLSPVVGLAFTFFGVFLGRGFINR